MKKIISFLTILFFIFSLPQNAYANDNNELSFGVIGKIFPMSKNDKAPFDGVLFDQRASSEILLREEKIKEECKIETEKKIESQKAKLSLEINNLRSLNKIQKEQYEARLKLKEEHNQFLEQQAIKNAKRQKNTIWWLVGGFVGGIALSIGVAFIVRSVSNNDQTIVVK